MIATELPYVVLPSGVPTAVVALLAAAGVAAWVALHRWGPRPRRRRMRAAMFALRSAAGFAALLASAQVILRWLLLATTWPIWPVALCGGVAVEAVLALYALERRVVPKRSGRALAALRVALVLLVAGMILQPVYSLSLSDTFPRYVAVLVDGSASMHLPQAQLSGAEKVRIAEMLSVLDRPHRFEAVRAELMALHEDLAAQTHWLGSVAGAEPESRRRQLEARREDLHESLKELRKRLGGQEKAIAAAINGRPAPPPDTLSGLTDLKARLALQAGEMLDEAAAITAEKAARQLPDRAERLLEAVRSAAAAVADAAGRIGAAGEKLDEAFYASLPDGQRGQVDAVARKTRYELAREVLLHRPKESAGSDKRGPGLLTRLGRDYRVKLYTFATAPAEADTRAWSAAHGRPGGAPATQPATQPATAPAEQMRTDLAAALRKVMTDFPARQLAGVIVLTDGRHNTPGDVESLARRLGARRVPICPVVLGGRRAPRDAAVVTLEAPETVYAGDRMYVTAELKLDGLAGKSVRVTLFDDDKSVDFKTVRVPADSFRTRVQLADEPGALGLHGYRLHLQEFDGEVFHTNNTYALTVSVTDDRTRLLIVEGRPRWEFRYLKNLFADRDRSVALQYVLFQPDQITEGPARPARSASAASGTDKVEATDLPADEGEWLKFDVIVLGDVSPSQLGADDIEAIRKFVADRGGTLIVLAGPRHMPHAFAGTPLADLLPTVPAKDAAPLTAAETFRIALTAEGREHVILRQKVDPAENLALWASLPDIHWRHTRLEAKPAATVLAYAVGPDSPPYVTAEAEKDPDERLAALRRHYERSTALMMVHKVAWGRVMMLTFDRTWRMRYRVGDTYHHKFWGQVLRWATSEKLPAGTALVKLGTDRPRYRPDETVRVRAKLLHEDLSGVVSGEVAVNILAGKRAVLRKAMTYVEGSQGMYSAELGKLPSGAYTAELDAPVAKPLLARDNKKKVVTGFSVDPATAIEQIELVPDRGLLSRLAGLSGGKLVDPPGAAGLPASLGEPELVLKRRREYPLWHSWPLLALLVALATGEWLLRKKEGLA